ncbi:MAG: maleylpyruvate isomerase N-terminal domain-containing protein, partial [Ilumatobacteraceae bacterium]
MLFEQASAHAAVVMARVSPAQLGDPTPCSDWNVQQLIDHMVAGADYLL